MKKLLALLLVAILSLSVFAGCATTTAPAESTEPADTAEDTAEETTDEMAEDTILVMVPPITNTYQDQLDRWSADFNAMYPNLTLEFETASWEDYNDKLGVQVNAGSPPDIAEVNYNMLGTRAESGLLVDVTEYVTEEELADYDASMLDYYRMDGKLYGIPTYNSIQSLGGNRDMLEAAGADVEKIQTEGWTFDEFVEIANAGTSDDTFGFVFANAGVAAIDMLPMFAASAGMPFAFDEDLKYAYTSQDFLALLESISGMIADGTMPDVAIEAGARWNMYLTGQTMIFGKGMPLFEGMAKANNEAIEADDGTAVEGSVISDYVFLPTPTMGDHEQGVIGSVSGFSMFRNADTTDEHLQNVAKALLFLTSGEPIAYTNNELYLPALSQTGRDAMASLESPYPRDESNIAATEYVAMYAVSPNTNITSELSAEAKLIEETVIVPKFQALIAQEITAQEMHDEIVKAAVEAFGEDGVVMD